MVINQSIKSFIDEQYRKLNPLSLLYRFSCFIFSRHHVNDAHVFEAVHARPLPVNDVTELDRVSQ